MPRLPNDRRFELRAPAKDVKCWEQAAWENRMTLSEWIRRTLNYSVGLVPSPPAPPKKAGK